MTDAVGGRRGVATWLVVAVVTIVALGAYFRVDGLMSSLWIDEFGTFWVTEDRLSTTVARALQFQGQSPFYYLIVWIPLHLFGESELALRLPSLIFGCAFILVLFLTARRWSSGGARVVLVACGARQC
jgi:mannosyltransferase